MKWKKRKAKTYVDFTPSSYYFHSNIFSSLKEDDQQNHKHSAGFSLGRSSGEGRKLAKMCKKKKNEGYTKL